MQKQQLIDSYILRVENAINCANNKKTKLTEQQFSIPGMSSDKIRILLNELVYPSSKYLEVGVWAGSTFVSALYKNNPIKAIAIDNFCQSGFTEEAYITADAKTTFLQNLVDNDIQNFTFLNTDCFNLKPEEKSIIDGINVYLYDGGHAADEQEKALTYFYDNLSDVFIFIVDDWNDEATKVGTRSAYQKTNTIVHKEWQFPTNFNRDIDSWWNGYYVAVCEKPAK